MNLGEEKYVVDDKQKNWSMVIGLAQTTDYHIDTLTVIKLGFLVIGIILTKMRSQWFSKKVQKFSQILTNNKQYIGILNTICGCFWVNYTILWILPYASHNVKIWWNISKKVEEDKEIFPFANFFIMIGLWIDVWFRYVLIDEDSKNSNHGMIQLVQIGDSLPQDKNEYKNMAHPFSQQYFPIIAGLTIGLQPNIPNFLLIAITILAHKLLQPGSTSKKPKQNKFTRLNIYFFLAWALGWVICFFSAPFQILLLCLCCGVLISVSMVSIFVGQFRREMGIRIKFVILVVIFIIFAIF